MRDITRVLALAAAAVMPGSALGQSAEPQTKPTIVLVHGAFAESSSWNDVIGELKRDGYTTIAAAKPLRSVAGDAAAVASIVRSILAPVVYSTQQRNIKRKPGEWT